MPMIPVKIPPGVYRNGTRYQAKGRWHSANRVRWHDGSIRPIGGWTPLAKPPNATEDYELYESVQGHPDEIARDGYVWRDNEKNQLRVWGTNRRLLLQGLDGINTDITPGDLPAGPSQPPDTQLGYGTGLYGRGAYGRQAPIPDVEAVRIARWKFDVWNDTLLASADWLNDDPTPDVHNTLYDYENGVDLDAQVVLNAPQGFEDFIVTQERMVMLFGDQGHLRRVQWCDSENNTDWEYDNTDNTAGYFDLPGKGRIVGGYNLRNQILILTETDVWIGRYLGPPYIYGFEKVGDDCTPVHKRAAATLPNGGMMWLGERNFWLFDGQVKELPCDLIDYLISDAAYEGLGKTFTWVNSPYSEVWFHYSSSVDRSPLVVVDPDAATPTIEPGHYVMWNWDTNTWSHGECIRTAAIAEGVFTYPQMLDIYGQNWIHEQQGFGFEDDSVYYEPFGLISPPSVRSGPIEQMNGETNMAIRAVYPDSQIGNAGFGGAVTPGPVNFYFESRRMPMGPFYQTPVYTYDPAIHDAQPIITTGCLGRDHMITLVSQLPADNTQVLWEWGDFRLDIAPMGTGRR